MLKPILLSKFLEVFATVAWPIIAANHLWNAMSCKDGLHMCYHTRSRCTGKQRYLSLTGSLSQASSSVHPGKISQSQLSAMVHLVDH